jgi:hypothetical protein
VPRRQRSRRRRQRLLPRGAHGTPTPEDLISGGLYGAIANALHQEPHRQISLASLAVSFGAVESKSTLAGKLRQAYSRPRRCESKGSLTQVVEVTAPAGLPSFSV